MRRITRHMSRILSSIPDIEMSNAVEQVRGGSKLGQGHRAGSMDNRLYFSIRRYSDHSDERQFGVRREDNSSRTNSHEIFSGIEAIEVSEERCESAHTGICPCCQGVGDSRVVSDFYLVQRIRGQEFTVSKETETAVLTC